MLLAQVPQLLGLPLQQGPGGGAEEPGGASVSGAAIEAEGDRPPSKTCSKCKAVKPSGDFFRDKSKPDGLYSQVLIIALFAYCMQAGLYPARGTGTLELLLLLMLRRTSG